MPTRIVVDVRRALDFGIGTYIRSLLHALAAIDRSDEYVLVALPNHKGDQAGQTGEGAFSALPPNFKTVTYRQTDSYALNHVAFPWFLHRLRPSLVHIPLNQVPLFMMEPYVVTIHDMSRLLFETGSGLRIETRRFLLRRGLLRAKRILAVSEATRRDVHDALGIPADRIRVVYNAPNPGFFLPAWAGRASWNATRSTIPSCSTPAISARKKTFVAWWKPSPWSANSFRATPSTATCT